MAVPSAGHSGAAAPEGGAGVWQTRGGCNSPGGGESVLQLRTRLPRGQIRVMKRFSGTVGDRLLGKRRG